MLRIPENDVLTTLEIQEFPCVQSQARKKKLRNPVTGVRSFINFQNGLSQLYIPHL